jgi:hypothetical protein
MTGGASPGILGKLVHPPPPVAPMKLKPGSVTGMTSGMSHELPHESPHETPQQLFPLTGPQPEPHDRPQDWPHALTQDPMGRAECRYP